jgi:hypothetical protein
MSDDAFHLNRPVHLARRDVFYERAVQLTKKLNEQKTLSERQKTAEAALHSFCEARKHAEAANRSDKTSLENRLFLDLLDTALDNAQSITRMLRRRQSSQAEDCTICRFLGTSEVHQKMSTHYRRSAAYILKGLLLLLQNADSPYERLRKTSLAKMNAADKTRYDKAREHLNETLES